MVIMRTKTAENRGDILRFEINPKEKISLYLIVPNLKKPLCHKGFCESSVACHPDRRLLMHTKKTCTEKVQAGSCTYSSIYSFR